MATSCPPSMTRFAIRDALIAGEDVPIKKILMKNPAAFALIMKSILSGEEKTVSNTKDSLSLRHCSLSSSQYLAAFITDSFEFQSPNIS